MKLIDNSHLPPMTGSVDPQAETDDRAAVDIFSPVVHVIVAILAALIILFGGWLVFFGGG